MKDKGNLILLIVVVVLLVGMIVFSYMRKRKYNNELGQMRKDLKIGDKVMTDTGVVGTLVDTYEEEGYQYFVLKSGAGNHYGYFAVHANAIYYVFGKDKAEKKPNLGINQKDKNLDGVAETTETAAEQPNQAQSTENTTQINEQPKETNPNTSTENKTANVEKQPAASTKKSNQKRASSKAKK